MWFSDILQYQQKAWHLTKQITINTFASTIGFLAALPAYYITIKKQAPGSTETYGGILRHSITKQGKEDIYKVLKPAIRASAFSSFSSWGVMLTLAEFNKDKSIAQRALISGITSSTIESYATYRSLWSMTSTWAGEKAAQQDSHKYAGRVFRATLAKNFFSNPSTMFVLLAANEHALSLPETNVFARYPLLVNIAAISLLQPLLAPLNTLQTHAQFDPGKTMKGHFQDICKISPLRLFRGSGSRAVFQSGKLGILTYTAQSLNKVMNNQ